MRYIYGIKKIRESNARERQAILRTLVKGDCEMTVMHQPQKAKHPDWAEQTASAVIPSRRMKLIEM